MRVVLFPFTGVRRTTGPVHLALYKLSHSKLQRKYTFDYFLTINDIHLTTPHIIIPQSIVHSEVAVVLRYTFATPTSSVVFPAFVMWCVAGFEIVV